MNAEQLPGKCRGGCKVAHDDRRTACAAMRSRIRQKKSLPLKADAEGRRNGSLPHHWQVVNGVMKAQGKADHKQARADLNLIEGHLQMLGREEAEVSRCREQAAIDLDHGHIDL